MALSARSLFSSEAALLAALTCYVASSDLAAGAPVRGVAVARRERRIPRPPARAMAERSDPARADQHAGIEPAGDAVVGRDRRDGGVRAHAHRRARQGRAHLRGAAAAAGAVADHRARLDRTHRRGQPDPRPAGAGAGAGRDQSALFQMGHRAGDGHRKLDARLPRGAGGAAQPAARPDRSRAAWRRASAARHLFGHHAAGDAGDPRRRGARLRHLDRQFRHPGDARHSRPLHGADHADLSAAARFRPARAGRGRGAGADPDGAGGDRAVAARAVRAPRRLCGRGASAPLLPFRLGGGRVLVEAVLWIALACIAILPLLALSPRRSRPRSAFRSTSTP